jgi:hypothetical protein
MTRADDLEREAAARWRAQAYSAAYAQPPRAPIPRVPRGLGVFFWTLVMAAFWLGFALGAWLI